MCGGVGEAFIKSEIITERSGLEPLEVVTQQPPEELSGEVCDSHQSTPGCIDGAGGGGAADWSNYRRRPEDQTVADVVDVVGIHPAGGRTGDVCSPVQLAGSHPSSLRKSLLLTIYTIKYQLQEKLGSLPRQGFSLCCVVDILKLC